MEKFVVRDFEKTELQQTDLPPCSKNSVQLAFMLFFWKEWKCNAINVKDAFLQGKPIERDVFVDFAAESKAANVIWKLKTWYMRVKEELISLGEMPCHYKPWLFYWHYRESLYTVITTHVGDMCWKQAVSLRETSLRSFMKHSILTKKLKFNSNIQIWA